MTAQPLTGLRVVELARVLAGPWAGQMLADLGAEVVKIEAPGGDETRGWGPPYMGEDAAYFHGTNRGKRSVIADFRDTEDLKRVKKLIAGADVVIENFKVGGLVRFGLDAASLRAADPRLIVCSITGFGQSGPYAARAGYDAMIQGLSGLMSVTGDPGGPPQKVGVALTDILTGCYATSAILAALHRRSKTGLGDAIDLALFDTAVACMANQAMNFLATGEAPGRMGNAHPNIVPYQTFECSDGHLMLAVGNDGQFARACAVLGLDDMAADPALATNAGRLAHRTVVVAGVSEAMAIRSRADLLAAFEAAKVPAGPINDMADVFADPQALARGLQIEPGGVPGVRTPFRFAEAEAGSGRPAPKLGIDQDFDWS